MPLYYQKKSTDTDTDDTSLDDEAAAARYWTYEIENAQKVFRVWQDRCDKIIRRYRDERDKAKEGAKRFNILWSNVETLKPSLYAKEPKVVIERRFLEQNDTERVAGLVLERTVTVEIETSGFDEAVGGDETGALLDYLLCGRGQVWVRYEAEIDEEDESSAEELTSTGVSDEAGEEVEQSKTSLPVVTSERLCVDYVNRRDFLHDPARIWAEVRWAAKRAWLVKREVVKKFGKEIADLVEYQESMGAGSDMLKNDYDEKFGSPKEKRAEFWEIWDKGRRCVWIISPSLKDRIVKKQDDPLQLKDFWPCPKPLYATMSNDTLIPVPDYVEYQDQAEELDQLTERIDRITQAIKAVGIYDASQPDLATLMQLGTDNKLVPCETWAVLKDKGGLSGSIELFPLDMLIKTLETLYGAREKAKEVLYEITGIADILRGQSSPEETYGAQRIKGNFGTLRLKSRQKKVAKFCRSIIRIMVELIAQHFSAQTIAAITGIADPNSPDAANIQQALKLVSDARMRSFRIDVEDSSTVEVDIQQDKQDVTEFLNGAAQFINGVLPAAEKAPELMPVFGHMLLFAVRRFRTGRVLEGTFERAIAQLEQKAIAAVNQPPPPDPKVQAETIKAQAEKDKASADMQTRVFQDQTDKQQAAADMQMKQMEIQIAQIKAQADLAKIEAEKEKIRLEMQMAQENHARDSQMAEQKAGHETHKMEMDRSMKAEDHQRNAEMAEHQHRQKMEAGESQHVQKMEMTDPQGTLAKKSKTDVAKYEEKLGPMMEKLHAAMAQLAESHSAPVEVVRGPDGKVAGTRKQMRH